jgi:hypothetical protein
MSVVRIFGLMMSRESALVSILGREAAVPRTTVTMADIMKENRRLEVDLGGLQA